MGRKNEKDEIQYAACRFCGQMIQMGDDCDLTQPQAEEKATMLCKCSEAVDYQKEKQRKEKALKNVSTLFGENAPSGKKVEDGIINILNASIEEIYSGELAKATLNLRGGIKACISQNSKGEINVERMEVKKQKLTE